jgi:glycogen debranching enzyme
MKERNSKDYQKRAKKLKNAINQNFWTGRYYLDWIDKGDKHDIFSTDGNLLAILFGISNKNQSSAIQRHIKKKRINHPWASKTNDNPDERKRYVSRLNKLLGIGEYHNRWVWPWLGCIDASVKSRMGEKNEAKGLLAKIAQSIVRDKTCHEVYDQKGTPVKTGLWLGDFGLGFKSEAPYAWTAGLYIFAYHQIFHPTNTIITSFDKIFY